MNESPVAPKVQYKLIDNYLIALTEVSFLEVDDHILELSEKGYLVDNEFNPFTESAKGSFAMIQLTDDGKEAAQGLIDLKKL